MKKFTTLLLAILMVLPAMAADIPAGTKLYLTPNGNWKADGARFAAYFFGNGETWVSMTKVDGETDLYEVTSPNKNYKNVIFCRMNPGAAANNWNNKWNQTADLIYDGTNNHYTVKEGTWDNGGGTWSYYGESKEVMVALSYAPSGRILVGDEITFSVSVVNADNYTSVIKVDGEEIAGTTWTAQAGKHTAQAVVTHAGGITESDIVNITNVEAITTQFNVYLKKPDGWDTANIHFWGNDFECVWPGKQMTATVVDGVDYFYYTFYNTTTVSVIFNNGSEQTVNITGVTDDVYYELGGKNGEGKYAVKDVTIYDANITAGYYYLVPGEWEVDEAWYAVYLFNKNNGKEAWSKGWLSEHNVYFELEGEDAYTHMIFCRMNPAFKDFGWNSGTEENDAAKRVWNQTADLTYTVPVSGNIARYVITGWGNDGISEGNWEEVEIGSGVNRVELAGGIGYAYGVVSAEGAIEVYNVNGAVVARGNDTIDLRGLGRGVYIIRNGNQVRKVVR